MYEHLLIMHERPHVRQLWFVLSHMLLLLQLLLLLLVLPALTLHSLRAYALCAKFRKTNASLIVRKAQATV
jgi:hypothetical protein